MEVIPVIDLLNGCVVHAQRGQRNCYRPIESSLCDSSQPLAVVQALLGLYPFKRLYIADLDAIQGQGHNSPTIREIYNRYPELDIWLDGGFTSAQELELEEAGGLTCVLGSENLASAAHYLEMKSSARQSMVLSLDFGVDGHMGPAELLHMPREWPDQVIAMTLARVGSNEGPDLQILGKVLQTSRAVTPASRIYAAGGVRHLADLKAVAERGVGGALVATALHNGSISPEEIAALESG